MTEYKVITESSDYVNTSLKTATDEGWTPVSHSIHTYTVTYDHKPRTTVSILLRKYNRECPTELSKEIAKDISTENKDA